MKNSIGKICYNSLAKSLNGSKVLLISPTEESSRRIWFELQKVGKQATFFTVKTPFPTEKTIEEGYDIAIRTGISNIITIGSGSICDIGKGISNLYENNVKKVNDLKNIKKIISKPNIIPILSIASTISPVHSTSSWLCLHQEDDILVNRSCKSINEVVFDHEFIEKSSSFCKEAILGYLLANLYDTIFSYCLDKSINGYNDTIIKEEISIKIMNYMETIKNNNNIMMMNDNITYYCNLAFVLGILRSDIYTTSKQLGPSRWPGIIEKACFINLLKQNRTTRPPFSWYVSALLPKCFEIINNNNDNDITSSVSKLAYKILSEIVEFDKLTSIINTNSKFTKTKILQLQDIDSKNYKQKNKDISITASQLLEIEIMNAEFNDDDDNNKKKDPLLEMLNSDIMLDITQEIFQSSL